MQRLIHSLRHPQRGSRTQALRCCLLLILLASLLPAPAARGQEQAVDVQAILDAMTVADRVGQLFVVTYEGNDVGPTSDIAELIRTYRIGGVLLQADKGNLRNLTPAGTSANVAEQLARLTNRLQSLAFDGNLPEERALAPSLDDIEPLPVPENRGVTLPLFIGLEQEGDGFPYSEAFAGFTPLPSNMALGATWSPEDAAVIGQIVGAELAAVGVNLLLGPSLDVLDAPRLDTRASLGVRSFGGSPFWVGRLGRAFIGGVHQGSANRVATFAKHFPGQGSSDRLPEDEIATVQKTREELAAVEMAPFAAAIQPGTLERLLSPAVAPPELRSQASTTTDGLVSTHIRYAGVQGSSEGVPPISLAPQLGQELLNSPGLAEWRKAGGAVMSDALGAPAIRLYYDPTLQNFPHKRIAQEALVAGNDMLLLARFALTDSWPDEQQNIKETVTFFQEKYRADADFRRRVDAAVLRILTIKARLNPELSLASALVDGSNLAERVGQDAATVAQVARDAVTLISPSPSELAQRMPTGPGRNDSILIITDARTARECPQADCPPFPLVEPNALSEIILRLYGPQASGQLEPERVNSLTFQQLSDHLAGLPTDLPGAEIDRLLASANWLVFAMLDVDPEAPAANALRQFLSQRPEFRESKRLVVLALNAPYFLDATDIAKLTAYFGVYSKTPPFLEAAVRALFREFTPTGASPVTISGTNYNLTEKLRPDPNQTILLQVPDVRVQMGTNTFTAKVGDTLRVVAGPILDLNGRLVPDGTLTSFKLKQRADQFQLPLQDSGTVDGYAEALVVLERAGDFEVQVTSGQASGSLSLLLSIVDEAQGEAQVAVATATPTPEPTATATPTTTPTPLPTATPSPTPAPTPLPLPLPPRRVDLGALIVALAVILTVVTGSFFALGAMAQVPETAVRNALMVVVGGLLAFSLYGLGLLPGATWLQREWRPWGAAIVALLGSMAPLLALRVRARRERE